MTTLRAKITILTPLLIIPLLCAGQNSLNKKDSAIVNRYLQTINSPKENYYYLLSRKTWLKPIDMKRDSALLVQFLSHPNSSGSYESHFVYDYSQIRSFRTKDSILFHGYLPSGAKLKNQFSTAERWQEHIKIKYEVPKWTGSPYFQPGTSGFSNYNSLSPKTSYYMSNRYDYMYEIKQRSKREP